MRIHNLLEEIVLDKINDFLKEYRDKKPSDDLAIVEEYMPDVACYVLNRIDPVYVVSGRGLAYLDIDYIEKLQRDADLVTLINQGIERVTTVQRPHYEKKKERMTGPAKGNFFNFPIIKGRIFNSLNFEPVFDIDVELLERRERVAMIEETWPNPCRVVANTAGNFYFWPQPLPAKDCGEKIRRELELAVRSDRFEEMRHFFTVELDAEEGVIDYFRVNKILTLKDLYLVPKE
ncbi:MAG: late competence development ComFB family protein [Spirochaetales bacterium]|nr:late competence development ComFB family protein [Spirochaetales bacterium]